MRVVVVGASGTVGQAVAHAFRQQGDEVIEASRRSEPPLDITDPASIDAFFDHVGAVDAIVSATGSTPFVSVNEATAEEFQKGLSNKLLGQINLVLYGKKYLNDGGSVTLSAGILNHHPVGGSVISSTVNGGLEAFAHAAALELERGLRVNVVSASVIAEALDSYGEYFVGFEPIPAARAASYFVRSAHGIENGETFLVFS